MDLEDYHRDENATQPSNGALFIWVVFSLNTIKLDDKAFLVILNEIDYHLKTVIQILYRTMKIVAQMASLKANVSSLGIREVWETSFSREPQVYVEKKLKPKA